MYYLVAAMVLPSREEIEFAFTVEDLKIKQLSLVASRQGRRMDKFAD
jgi:hypothetical protein